MDLIIIRSRVIILITMLLLISCHSSKEIKYGADSCHYCSMTIVDNQHAAMTITKKGKVLKFDSIECMLRHKHNTSSTENIHWVTTYDNPEQLSEANACFYIQNDAIPSPMGANLTAFKDLINLHKKTSPDEKTYTWQEIQHLIKNNNNHQHNTHH